MPTLILTALSVIIVAFTLVAGTNYINPSIHGRIEVTRVLAAQYAAISSAIATYRIENQGVFPETLDDVKGYVARGALAGYGPRSEMFSWTLEPLSEGKPGLCLSFTGAQDTDEGTLAGLQRFALDLQSQVGSRLSFGATCSAEATVMKPGDIATHITTSGESLSLRLEER